MLLLRPPYKFVFPFRVRIIFVFIWLATGTYKGNAQQSSSFLIEQKLKACDLYSSPFVDTEKINHTELLLLHYSGNGFQLSWKDPHKVMDLMYELVHSELEGLNPTDYHITLLNYYTNSKGLDELGQANFDMLLTDAFFSYGTHLLGGKVDPKMLYPGKWDSKKRSADLVFLLKRGLENENISLVLNELKPKAHGYTALKDHLQLFINIQQHGGWSTIPGGPPLSRGDSSDRISIIKKRLHISGHLHVDPSPIEEEEKVFDSLLENAVKTFQLQHGLNGDGIIGMETLDALNIPVEDYIHKIKVNLERFRWLPWELGDKYIQINIPEFQLWVNDHDLIVLTMKAIVGRPDRSTPVFSSAIQYVVLNPTWTIPPTILREDVLPAVKKDSTYLKNNRLRVFNKQGEEVDPTSIEWSTISIKSFPYIIRQDPGTGNSLGLIKFQFPNQYTIFLHDTNAWFLFNKSYRALSSGCIRIEHPFTLATYLLEDTKWTKEKLKREIANGKTTTIVFSKPIPIHIFYFTTFVDHHNSLQWREDIYGLDDALLFALGRMK